jgi:hypothetical protein
MKKGNISIGVAIAIVALLFAGMGIALAGTENVDEVYFYQESMVEGTGLVMVDKDISTAPWVPSQNLETNLHIHGCGDYDVDQTLKAVIVSKYATLGGTYGPGNVYRPAGTFLGDVSQSIDYCEDAEMTFKPVALTSGSMTLVDDESSILWKEDLCIKNHQIGTAMRAKYTDASYIKKTIESNVTCVEPYLINHEKYPGESNPETAVFGYGLAKMDILSTVSGASHVGVVVKDTDPHITVLRVSEDYIGNFTIEKNMKVKKNKDISTKGDGKDWLPCPFESDDC